MGKTIHCSFVPVEQRRCTKKVLHHGNSRPDDGRFILNARIIIANQAQNVKLTITRVWLEENRHPDDSIAKIPVFLKDASHITTDILKWQQQSCLPLLTEEWKGSCSTTIRLQYESTKIVLRYYMRVRRLFQNKRGSADHFLRFCREMENWWKASRLLPVRVHFLPL